MPVRLIAIDIDRTLLDNERRVSERNRAALADAIHRDIVVALCSGRDLPSSRAVAGPLRLPLWLVVQNGSLVIDPDGRAVYTCTLSPDAARRAVDVLDRHSLAPVVYEVYPDAHRFWWQEGARSAPGMLEFRAAHGAVVTKVPDIRAVLTRPVSHIEVFDDADRVLAADEELRGNAGFVPITNLSSSQKGAALMGVYPTGTAKERALAAVAETLAIAPAEVLAIGDNLNDVGMVRWAGTGVMVGNGPPDALAAADWVAPPNDRDGVAEAIELFSH